MTEENQIRNWPKKNWPESLLEIPEPPKQLRIRGNWPEQNIRLCIVGPRKFSEYGQNVCENIIAGLSNYPISILSGLAFGIDSIAHQVALKNNINTIAIPGSGLLDNSIYPHAHLNLAYEILDSGGCLISEFPDNFKATNWAFPRRNRIMVGLSDATLIIEAGQKSGTMITARMSIDYNHDLLAVPGSVLHENSAGTNQLIKDGAHLVRNAEDILNFFGLESQRQVSINNLSDTERMVFDQITPNTYFNDLVEKKILPLDKLNAVISALEIKNLIEVIADKICQK